MKVYLKPQLITVSLTAMTTIFTASNYSAVREDYSYNDILGNIGDEPGI